MTFRRDYATANTSEFILKLLFSGASSRKCNPNTREL
ncbi:hypothetical protein EDD76_112161 [Kineothrix alysoides]|uniref:Uncharacterized protein n=1 Tax=Kineothrix alysoides TaxID=1469948 RepID=A0A4R1QTB8_9FIRM|nr:hypothetical protein EDD76_112161 [Kineothrix alysoides]